jgi:hypothetical protein
MRALRENSLIRGKLVTNNAALESVPLEDFYECDFVLQQTRHFSEILSERDLQMSSDELDAVSSSNSEMTDSANSGSGSE